MIFLIRKLKKKKGLNRVLTEYLPILIPGWVGSLTHAAIHLGWD